MANYVPLSRNLGAEWPTSLNNFPVTLSVFVGINFVRMQAACEYEEEKEIIVIPVYK